MAVIGGALPLLTPAAMRPGGMLHVGRGVSREGALGVAVAMEGIHVTRSLVGGTGAICTLLCVAVPSPALLLLVVVVLLVVVLLVVVVLLPGGLLVPLLAVSWRHAQPHAAGANAACSDAARAGGCGALEAGRRLKIWPALKMCSRTGASSASAQPAGTAAIRTCIMPTRRLPIAHRRALGRVEPAPFDEGKRAARGPGAARWAVSLQ